MNCPKCGASINQGELFCRICGSSLQVVSNTVAPIQQQVASNNEVQMTIQQDILVNTVQPIPVDNTLSQAQAIPEQPVVENPSSLLDQIRQMDANNVQANNIQTQVTVPPQVNQPVQINNQFQYPNYNNYQGAIQREQINNLHDDLIEAYIGKNINKLRRSGFSLPAFLFGVFYIFYRKMWTFGVFFLVAATIIDFFMPSFSLKLLFVAWIAIGASFKGMYIKHVKNQVNKIISINRVSSEEELLALCGKKGGTSILGIFFPLIIIFVLIALLLYMYGNPTFKENINEITGHKWIGIDNSALYLNDDYTYIWYADDSNHEDNYYQGTYGVYYGNSALNFVNTDLSRFGITESSEKQRIAERDSSFNNNALEHYYVLVLNQGKMTVDGKTEINAVTMPYIGFYYDDEKYFDFIDIKENKIMLAREDSSRLGKLDKLLYWIPAKNSNMNMSINVSINNGELQYKFSPNISTVCEVAIKNKETGSYKSVKDYFKKGLELSNNTKVSEVSIQKISDRDWSYVTVQNFKIEKYSGVEVTIPDGKITGIYAIIYDKKIYEIMLLFSSYNMGACVEGFDVTLSSLRLSE